MTKVQTVSLLNYEGKIKIDKNKDFIFLSISEDVGHAQEVFNNYVGHSLKFYYGSERFKFDFKLQYRDLEDVYGDTETKETMYVILNNTSTSAILEDFALTFHERAKEINNGNI